MERELYKHRRWLKSQYEKKSSNEIAKKCGVKGTTIRWWLHKFKIKIRSLSEAHSLAQSNHVNLTKEALEFLVGNLLGDGHLAIQSKVSAWYSNGSKFKSFSEWLSDRFSSYGMEQLGKICKCSDKVPGYNKKHTYFNYASKHYIELKEIHKKWYRKAREDERYKTGRQRKWIKILPEDLKLTPLVCLMWYLGDGHLNKVGKYILMCTNGFEKEEVARLAAMLNGLGFTGWRQNCNNSIYIPTKSTKDFLNYIGPCPIECYNYRWGVI